MKSRRFHIILLLSLIWNLSFSQQATNYTIKDGLPSNHIYKIVQDDNGFIWTITDNGIVRYNGTEFKRFTTEDGLPTNDIWDILITADGKVWFFCKASEIGYIENEVVYSFEAKKKGTNFFPLKIIVYNSNVFFGSGNQLYYLNTDKEWESIPESLKNDSTNSDFKKAIKTQGMVKELLQTTSIIQFREIDSLAFWLTKENYYILNTKTGKLVMENVFSQTKEYFSPYARMDFYENQFQISNTNTLLLLNEQYKISEKIAIPAYLNSHYSFKDKSENLWIATFKTGLHKIPEIYRKIEYVLPSEKVNSINKFRGGIIASVFDLGIYYYDKEKIQFLSYIKKTGHTYPPVCVDTLESIFYINQNILIKETYNYKNEFVALQERVLEETVKQLIYFDGYLWGVGVLDLKKIDSKTFEIIEKYNEINVNSLLVFNDILYLCNSNGIKKSVKGKFIDIKPPEVIPQVPIIKLVAVDNEWLLLCTDGYGAYITNFKETVFLEETQFLTVRDAYIQNKELWLATNAGLYLYHKKQNTFSFVKKYSEEQGLPARKINSVVLEDNLVFAATDNGIAIFDRNNTSTSQLLKIYIENVFYNGTNVSEKQPLLSYTKDNSINLKVSTINFSEMESPVAFLYKLLPNQNEWVETTSSILNFSDLRPGSYTLQIKLEDFEESYSFTIAPLWWQKTGVKATFIVFVMLLIGIILYQIRKQELAKKTAKITAQKKLAEYKLHALRSQMNPHFVFNSLAAIQYHINKNDFQTSEKYLVKFSKIIRQFFELSKENEIVLAEEIKLLQTYLDMEKLRFKEKLNFSFSIDESLQIEDFKIPTMLLQPIVENAVNHGIFNKNEQGNLEINFKKIAYNEVLIEIIDDGVGFGATKKIKNGKINSSEVLEDRLTYLNESKKWEINYSTSVAFPEKIYIGNISAFTIKNLE